MGYSIGTGYGLQYQRPLNRTEGSKYAEAALADGFSGGSVTCSDEFFNELINID